MHGIGCSLIEILANADGGDYRGSMIAGEEGHEYEFFIKSSLIDTRR